MTHYIFFKKHLSFFCLLLIVFPGLSLATREQDMRLIRAVQKNDLNDLDACMRLRGSPYVFQVRDDAGKDLVGVAAKRGHLGLIGFLLSYGAPLDTKDREGKTPLFWAVEKGFEEESFYLLKQGADPNAVDGKGSSPLKVAMEADRYGLVEALVSHGADINKRYGDRQESLLHGVIRKGNAPLLTRLLELGAIPWGRDRDGITPLLRAVERGELESVKVLLAMRANPDDKTHQGISALQVAAYRGHRDILEILIRAGAQLIYRAPEEMGDGNFMDYLRQGGSLSQDDFYKLLKDIYEDFSRGGAEKALYDTARLHELLWGKGLEAYEDVYVRYGNLLERYPHHGAGHFRIAAVMEKGPSFSLNAEKVFFHYKRAAETGHEIAQQRAALMEALGPRVYKDIASLKENSLKKYLKAKDKKDREISQDFEIRDEDEVLFRLNEDYARCRDVLEKLKGDRAADLLRINYDFIVTDPYQEEYDVDFDREVSQEEIEGDRLQNVRGKLQRLIKQHPAYDKRFRKILSDVIENISESEEDLLKRKFVWLFRRNNTTEESVGEFALKLIQNEGRCGDGLSEYLDEEIGVFLKEEGEGTCLGGVLSKVIQAYKQRFMIQHRTPFVESVEEATEAVRLLRQRMRLPLGLIGKFNAPLYPSLGFGQEERYCPERVTKLFFEGGEIVFQRKGQQRSVFVEPFTPNFILRLMMSAYESNIIKNEHLQKYVQDHPSLGPIYDEAIIEGQDHPYFDMRVADGIHYFTEDFFKFLLKEQGFLIF